MMNFQEKLARAKTNSPPHPEYTAAFLFERWSAKAAKLLVNGLRNREREHVTTVRTDNLNANRQPLSIQPGWNRRCRQPTNRRERDPIQHCGVGNLVPVRTPE